MTTFSQLVDDVIEEMHRPDLRGQIVRAVNQAIRAVHARPNSGSNVGFDENRQEVKLLLPAEGSLMWAIPEVGRFQAIESVYSVDLERQIDERTPALLGVNSDIALADFGWYRSGPGIHFSEALAGNTLLLAYFDYPRRLAYFAAGTRSLVYNAATDGYAVTGVGGVDEETAYAQSTNWLLMRWEDCIALGVRSIIYRNLGDIERARLAYSAFEQERLVVWQAEAKTVIGSL